MALAKWRDGRNEEGREDSWCAPSGKRSGLTLRSRAVRRPAEPAIETMPWQELAQRVTCSRALLLRLPSRAVRRAAPCDRDHVFATLIRRELAGGAP